MYDDAIRSLIGQTDRAFAAVVASLEELVRGHSCEVLADERPLCIYIIRLLD